MSERNTSTHATFEDYRSSQRIAVVIRWFILLPWLAFINYGAQKPAHPAVNSLGAILIILNAFIHWRILKGRPITWPYVFALSLMDLCLITTGILLTDRFENTLFIFYYPALLGIALIFSRAISFGLVAIVAAVYTGMGFTLEPKVDTSVLFSGEQKQLAVRLVCMVAVVVAANLMTRLERERRREAVNAERARMEENLRLQRRAQEAEQELQRERIRISREIHDGAAQTAYVLSLGLETCLHVAKEDPSHLLERLKALHTQSRQALWELRYPVNLGPLFEGRRLAQILQDHLNNFRTITSIAAELRIGGRERELPMGVKQRLFSVVHNALANAYRHAQASRVEVELAYQDEALRLLIRDDGVGLDTSRLDASPGHGLRNMRHIAEELGARFEVLSRPGEGTSVSLTLPLTEVRGEPPASDDR